MLIMDDQSSHDDDESQDNDLDLEDIDDDEDDETPADTDKDDPKKGETADEVKERQKKAWLANIRAGKKTLDDMPENLAWLKPDVESDLKADKKPEPKPDELESKIRKTLQAEREAQDFNALVDSLGESDLDSEKAAQLQEDYEGLIADGVPKFKALATACRLNGLKDAQTMLSERRRKGMTLPPFGTRKREVLSKDKMTEMEKKFAGDLPGGFKA